MSTEAVAAVEERNHIALIERFVAGVTEVCGNTGKIEVDAVMFGGGIDAIQVPNSLIFDKSRYRTPGYRKNFLIDRFPLRINLSIPDHIKPLPQSVPRFSIGWKQCSHRGGEENLPRNSPVYVQFIIDLLPDAHLDSDWRK